MGRATVSSGEMGMLKSICCLCPTYFRPKMVENSIAQFLRQNWDNKHLIVLDDAGQLKPRKEKNWEIISTDKRYPSITSKYNALLDMAKDFDYIAIWEDDDVYLPLHLKFSIETDTWSKPSFVLSTYKGLQKEDSSGRFHASLVFNREWLVKHGGWIETDRADFDQMLIQKCLKLTPPHDPYKFGSPQYIFRWGSTGHYHGQSYMKSPDDCEWYKRLERKWGGNLIPIDPKFDEETKRLYNT